MGLHRFTLRRRKHGRRRPAPLVVRVANCASVSTPAAKATDTFRRALNTPGKFGLPDVVLGQEMADVHAAVTAGPEWIVNQRLPYGSPASGLAIAARRTRAAVVEATLLPGTPGTREGGGIRQRPILIDKVVVDPHHSTSWTVRFASGHAAPARAPRDRARFMDLFKELRARVKGGDLNVVGRFAARVFFGRRVFTVGVLHLVVSRWIPAEGPHPVDHGSDHPGVDVLLWPERKLR